MLPSRSPGDDAHADSEPEPVPAAADATPPRTPAAPGDGNGEVMAAVDPDSDADPEFVIADVSREDAWVAVDRADAPVLREWR